MRASDVNLYELDRLVDTVIHRDGVRLHAQLATGAVGADMAANVRTAQFVSATIAAFPSAQAKNRARIRLFHELNAQETMPWWRRWFGETPARAIAVAVAVVLLLSTGTPWLLQQLSPDESGASSVDVLASLEDNLANAGELADQARQLIASGDDRAALAAAERLTDEITAVRRSIQRAESPAQIDAGFSELLAHSDVVLSGLEATVAARPRLGDDTAVAIAASVSITYAEAIEALAVGSPPVAGATGRLRLSIDELGRPAARTAAIISEYQAFRIDSTGGQWIKLESTISSSSGSTVLAGDLPSGTYTRVKIRAISPSGRSTTAEIVRPFVVTTAATASIAPASIVWVDEGDDGPFADRTSTGYVPTDAGELTDQTSNTGTTNEGEGDDAPPPNSDNLVVAEEIDSTGTDNSSGNAEATAPVSSVDESEGDTLQNGGTTATAPNDDGDSDEPTRAEEEITPNADDAAATGSDEDASLTAPILVADDEGSSAPIEPETTLETVDLISSDESTEFIAPDDAPDIESTEELAEAGNDNGRLEAPGLKKDRRQIAAVKPENPADPDAGFSLTANPPGKGKGNATGQLKNGAEEGPTVVEPVVVEEPTLDGPSNRKGSAPGQHKDDTVEVPATIEEPPVVEEPTVDEPVVVEEPVVEEPDTVEEPTLVGEPTDDEPGVEEPETVEDLVVVEEPTSDEPSNGKSSAPGQQKDEVVEEPATIREPTVVEEPAVDGLDTSDNESGGSHHEKEHPSNGKSKGKKG